MNAKAELERANEDIAIRKLQAQAKMDTERMITGVKVLIAFSFYHRDNNY